MHSGEERTIWPEYKGINVDNANGNVKKDNHELNVYKVASEKSLVLIVELIESEFIMIETQI